MSGKKLTPEQAMNLNPDVIESPAQRAAREAAEAAAFVANMSQNTKEQPGEAQELDKARRGVRSINLKGKK